MKFKFSFNESFSIHLVLGLKKKMINQLSKFFKYTPKLIFKHGDKDAVAKPSSCCQEKKFAGEILKSSNITICLVFAWPKSS